MRAMNQWNRHKAEVVHIDKVTLQYVSMTKSCVVDYLVPLCIVYDSRLRSTKFTTPLILYVFDPSCSVTDVCMQSIQYVLQ